MDTPKTLVMAALLALLLAAGCATQPNQHGIPNFGQTGPDRYHGGELTDAGRAWLAANGVTNIIRLDGGAEPGGWAAVVAEPISTWEQWFGGAAMDGKIVRAVALSEEIVPPLRAKAPVPTALLVTEPTAPTLFTPICSVPVFSVVVPL